MTFAIILALMGLVGGVWALFLMGWFYGYYQSGQFFKDWGFR